MSDYFKNLFQRRRRFINSKPSTGFVIMNPDAPETLKFYSSTKTTKTTRTLFWTDEACNAKVYDTESQAKGHVTRLKKRNEKYKNIEIVSVESQMVDAFEINMNTCEVRPCKAWPSEIENKSVFRTKLEALIDEKTNNQKEKANLVLNLKDVDDKIKQIENQIVEINKGEFE